MKNTLYIFNFIAILGFTSATFAQDIHFSQFYQTPLIINPSLTGVFNGDQRACLNYRNQWNDFAPFTTSSISFDSKIFERKMKNKHLGAGLNINRDFAGDSKLSTTQFQASLASTIEIGKGQNISAGIQGGFTQRAMDGALKWGSQYDGYGFDPTKSGETGYFENYTFGDFSAGISWNFGKSETNVSSADYLGASAGVAVLHINAPKQGIDLDKLNQVLVVHGNAVIGMKGKRIALIPSLLYMQQGPLKEITTGAMVRLTIRKESKYTGFMKAVSAYLGSYYRFGDAVVPSCMFEVANYCLGFSYDANTSKLKEATNGKGAFEISLRFINPDPFKHKGYNHRALM